MNLKRYELLKKVVDIIKSTNPDEITVNDYSSELQIRFEWKEQNIKSPQNQEKK